VGERKTTANRVYTEAIFIIFILSFIFKKVQQSNKILLSFDQITRNQYASKMLSLKISAVAHIK